MDINKLAFLKIWKDSSCRGVLLFLWHRFLLWNFERVFLTTLGLLLCWGGGIFNCFISEVNAKPWIRFLNTDTTESDDQKLIAITKTTTTWVGSIRCRCSIEEVLIIAFVMLWDGITSSIARNNWLGVMQGCWTSKLTSDIFTRYLRLILAVK